jgi:hypothetical protein
LTALANSARASGLASETSASLPAMEEIFKPN